MVKQEEKRGVDASPLPGADLASTRFAAFPVTLDVVIRECRAEDLPALEWFSLFSQERALIQRLFEQHLRGEALMLTAEVNGEASGQLWLDFRGRPDGLTGEIWGVRVMPCLQGRGIGSRLLRAAEAAMRMRGCRGAELGVEIDNPRARRLYERHGYSLDRTELVQHRGSQAGSSMQWILCKRFGAPERPRRIDASAQGHSGPATATALRP